MIDLSRLQYTGVISNFFRNARRAFGRLLAGSHSPSLDEIHEHWSKKASYDQNWSERGRQAVILAGDFSSACDIGCGPMMSLRHHLASGTQYLPCDAHGWTDEVVHCDLSNLDLPKDSITRSDVVFVLGVLEYLPDVPAVLRALAKFNRPVVFSYCSTDLSARRDRWWLNSYSSSEIVELAAAAGLKIQREASVGPAQQVYYSVPAKT